jgi:hypothetical protein
MKAMLKKFSEGCKKVSRVFKMIFGYGIMITLFVGGLTFFGYLAALIAGGDVAVAICDFIYKKIVPCMIYVTTSLVLFGLVTMYLAGEFALAPDKKVKKAKIDKSEGER